MSRLGFTPAPGAQHHHGQAPVVMDPAPDTQWQQILADLPAAYAQALEDRADRLLEFAPSTYTDREAALRLAARELELAGMPFLSEREAA